MLRAASEGTRQKGEPWSTGATMLQGTGEVIRIRES